MIAITGGGTGGHLSIAKAICQEYNKRGVRPIFIGSTNGQDKKWFENYHGFSKSYFLDSSGVVNKKGIKKILSVVNILKQSLKCKEIFNLHEVKKVFSVGGYSAAPASFAALMQNIPLFIHEQNAVLGKLNKLLKPFSKELFSSYENASFKTPYPINECFFESSRERKEFKSIIFLGGSQGASFINGLAKEMAKDLQKLNINIIHQCGEKEFISLKEFYAQEVIDADIFPFSHEIYKKIQKADFAISRAGASSLWELVANELPTLFIPFPYAAANHQYFNAKFLKEQNLSFLIPQKDVKKEEVLQLLQNAKINQISKGLKGQISQNGIKIIVDRLEKNLSPSS